MNKLHL